MNRRSLLIGLAATVASILANPLQILKAWPSTFRANTLSLDTARFDWEWGEEPGGRATHFEVICGTTTTIIQGPWARQVLIKDVVPGSGIYTNCTVVARNDCGATPAAAPFPAIHVDFKKNTVTILG